ncbi:MAG: hypothetical protein WCF36_11840 [Candidatus Nanopelagicales bacterium]
MIGADGTVATYDADGNLADTIVTPADTVALDPAGTRLAIGSTDTGRAVVVDLATKAIETVPGVSSVMTFGFNADGSVRAMSLRDGTVRRYEVGEGVPVTVPAGRAVSAAAEPGWYDPATDSLRMPIGESVVDALLGADLWVDQACGVPSRRLSGTCTSPAISRSARCAPRAPEVPRVRRTNHRCPVG